MATEAVLEATEVVLEAIEAEVAIVEVVSELLHHSQFLQRTPPECFQEECTIPDFEIGAVFEATEADFEAIEAVLETTVTLLDTKLVVQDLLFQVDNPGIGKCLHFPL